MLRSNSAGTVKLTWFILQKPLTPNINCVDCKYPTEEKRERIEKIKWKCIQFYAWMKLANTSSYNCINILFSGLCFLVCFSFIYSTWLFFFFLLSSDMSVFVCLFSILGHCPIKFPLQLVCSLTACMGSLCNGVISFCYYAEWLQV